MGGIVRHAARDTPVEDVDRAADRLPAEQQDGRPVQHLDPVGRDRIDRHGMVGGSVGRVDRANAVGQHTHPIALEAAQHRARRARAEGGGRHARQTGQRLPKLRADVADQRIAAQ